MASDNYTVVEKNPDPYETLNGLFATTTWVSQYQKGKTWLDLNEERDYGAWGRHICKPYANNLHLSPDR